MKYCPNCGKEIAEGVAYCNHCGAAVNGEKASNPQINVTINNQSAPMPAPVIPNRSIVLAIVLSLITCGIYSIYWFIVMTDEANALSNENGTSGALAFLFSLLTCGIYEIYWNYKMGQKMYKAGQLRGINISDNSVVYLLLGLFGLSIISYALIQNDLNKFSA